MSSPALPSFLCAPLPALLLFGGKGGVGKTTCAAAAGVSLALQNPEQRFLLVSVDPAHSLLDCLAGDAPPANLDVLELDAERELADFKAQHAETLREVARRGTFLDEEDIARFVDLSLPGLDELIAFVRIVQWIEQGRYTTLVVDTAPSGHTLRLLAMPSVLRDWLDALDALLAKYRYMKRLFRGHYKPDAADRLLLDLSQGCKRTQALLHSSRSCFVPVFLAEQLSLQETTRLLTQLGELSARVGPLLCNRLTPQNDCPRCRHMRQEQQRQLARFSDLLAGHEVWRLPLAAAEVRGVSTLQALYSTASRLSPGPAEQNIGADSEAPPRISSEPGDTIPDELAPSHPASAIPDTLSLLFFAGKGGVGKTTLACATALHVAREQRRQVILISTDPAHSVGHCLGVPAGPQPTTVAPGLQVLAPDAAAEWHALQQRYADELSEMLESSLPSLDLTFDREVMERMLSLCPPGVDEIMALSRVTDLLAEHPDALIVVDTAPTGHLLRLLELPEVLDQWIKALFAVLLKYRKLLHMPRLSDQLIALSKRLKGLRRLLHQPDRARLCAIAIPTALSLAETSDLVAACRRMELAIERLFINQCTVPTPCELCQAWVRHESGVIRALRELVAREGSTDVPRRSPPLGIAALTALGNQIYASSTLAPAPAIRERTRRDKERIPS